MTPAGKRRHLVKVYRKHTSTQNEYGEDVQAEREVLSAWASIEPLSGRDGLQMRQIRAELSHRITLPYCAAITPQHYVKYGTRTFHIVSAVNVQERGVESELLCAEQLS